MKLLPRVSNVQIQNCTVYFQVPYSRLGWVGRVRKKVVMWRMPMWWLSIQLFSCLLVVSISSQLHTPSPVTDDVTDLPSETSSLFCEQAVATFCETKSKALRNEGAVLVWLLTYQTRFVLMLKWEVRKQFLTASNFENLINWMNPILAFQPLIKSKSEARFLHYLKLQQNDNLRCLI